MFSSPQYSVKKVLVLGQFNLAPRESGRWMAFAAWEHDLAPKGFDAASAGKSPSKRAENWAHMGECLLISSSGCIGEWAMT